MLSNYLKYLISSIMFNGLVLYWLLISFCCFEKDYGLRGGKIIDKAKPSGNSWAIDVLTYAHSCTFIEKHNSIRFSWKIRHFMYDLSNDVRSYSILGQWPNNKVLFKLKSDVNNSQKALAGLAKCSGAYNQDVKIFQTKLLRSLKFRVVAVYEFFKNKSFEAADFGLIPNITSKTWWDIVKALRKITHYPKESMILYTKKVWILNSRNKKSLIWTSTILNKILQQLLCFVLEPLVELTSTFNSFGFRKYRSAKMAVGLLRSWLNASREKNIKLFSGKLRSNSWWMLDLNISGFFCKAHYEYLLANLFLPSIGIFFVQHLLSGRNLYRPIPINSSNSAFQESALFSVLVSFTLSNLVTVFKESVYYFIKSKDGSVTPEKVSPALYSYSHILCYLDSFVVLCYSRYILKVWFLPKGIQFLKERGLELSLEKIKFFCLRSKSKLKILGYTFHSENKWCTKSKIIKLNYVALYPRKFHFVQTIQILKQIFYKSLNLNAYRLIAKVNYILRGWCYYFNMGNCTYYRNFFRNLLYKMAWRWSHRKHSGWQKKRLAKAYFWMDKLNCMSKVSSKKYAIPYKSSMSENRRFFHGVFQSKWIYLYFINSKNTAGSILAYNVSHVLKPVDSYHSGKYDIIKWFFKVNRFPLNSSLKRII